MQMGARQGVDGALGLTEAGRVEGNGGGAPVAVSGWMCQGYPTPEVLSTGDVSQCHTSSAAIVAVLPVPMPVTTMTTG
jgi:hypothetical protein